MSPPFLITTTTNTPTSPPKVVHVCHNLDTALAEFPALFTGHYTVADLPRPASGLGTHADPRVIGFKIPRAVFFGGKVTDAEYSAITNCVKKVRDVTALGLPKNKTKKPQPSTSTAITDRPTPSPPPYSSFSPPSSSSAAAGPSTSPHHQTYPSAADEKRQLSLSLSGVGGTAAAEHAQSPSDPSSSDDALSSPPPYSNGLRVHFVKVQKRDVLAAGAFVPPPSAELIARIFRKKMGSALEKEQREKQLSL